MAAPSVDFQPRNQLVVLYQSAAFGVIASGLPPLSYQWLRDGSLIAGQTNDQLLLQQPTYADAGKYSVIVTDPTGSVASDEVVLSVNPPKPGNLDSSFLSGGFINNRISSVALQPDGKILIGGEFETVNGAVRRRIARLNRDGTTDHTFMEGLAPSKAGVVSVMALPDNKILIASLRSARLNSNGSSDAGYQDLSSIIPMAIARQQDKKVLVAGIGPVNGVFERSLVERLNEDGSRDSTFQMPRIKAAPTFGNLYSVALQEDGKAIIGGGFHTVNGVGRTNIARLNEDGTLDLGFEAGIFAANGLVRAIIVQDDGKVLIGGDFKDISGTARNGLARLNSDGSLDTAFRSGVSATDGSVLAIAIQNDGKVLIGGGFTRFNGLTRNRVARLNADGTLDDRFLSGFTAGPNGTVLSLQSQPDGKVIIAGSFSTVNGVGRKEIARLNNDGGLDFGFKNPIGGVLGHISSLALQSDGRIVATGNFLVGEGDWNRIARFNSNGVRDIEFPDALKGLEEMPQKIIAQPDNKILVILDYSSGGSGRHRIVRLTPDGALDPAFANNLPGANLRIWSAAIQTDGKILVGGSFSQMRGVNRTRIARLNANGTLDGSFGDGLAEFDTIWGAFALALQSDGKIVVGVEISAPNRQGVVRLNPDGSLDRDFAAPILVGSPSAIAVQSDDKVIIGGIFSVLDDSAVIGRNFARLQSNGTFDANFRGWSPGDNSIENIVLDDQGKALISGTFGLVRLTTDGALDSTFHVTGSASAIAVQSDRKVLGASGYLVDDIPTGKLVRLWGDPDRTFLINAIALGDSGIRIAWEALPNRTYEVQFKKGLNETSWTGLGGKVFATTSIATTLDINSGREGQRFYRVLLLP